MDIVHEEWRPVGEEFAGFPYEASSLGRVRRIGKQEPLGLFRHRDGYRQVFLSFGGKKRNAKAHRVVASAFYAQHRVDRRQVNHKNGCKADNQPSNLEYVTCKENHIHAVQQGLRERIGVGHFRRKMTMHQAESVRGLRRRGVSIDFLARWFNVSKQCIRLIEWRKTYIN